MVANGQDRVIGLPDDFGSRLTSVARALADLVARPVPASDDLLEVLGAMAELAYLTSGNGRYLRERGLVPL